MCRLRQCRQCDAELPEGAPDGLCVRCRSAATLATIASTEQATTIAVEAFEADVQAGPVQEAFAGRELGPVRLLGEIGRGGMGVVCRGHDRVLGRDVAVKFLPPVEGPDDPALKRFLDEARCAAAVHHANLTQIYHADLAEGTPYLVMQYIDGPSLRQLLARFGRLTLPLAVAILQDVAAGVSALHARGIFHRDLKPGNILLDTEGRVYVTDFGLALGAVPPGGSTEAGRAGSPAYMAPEAFDGRYSARSDVYALGIVACELLSAAVPFTGSLMEVIEQHRHAPLPRQPLHDASVPDAVIDVLERATHKQPMFRYKTPADFLRALSDAAGEPAPARAARSELATLVQRFRNPGTDASPPSVASGSSSLADTLARFAAAKRRQRPGATEPVPPPGSPVAAPTVPSGPQRIAVDLLCLRCGYNLRSMAQESRCPECGTPLAISLDRRRTVFAPSAWVRRVRAGLLLTVLSIIGGIFSLGFGLTMTVSVTTTGALGPPSADTPSVLSAITLAANLVAVVGILLGIWLATAPRKELPKVVDAGGLCRWLLLALLGSALVLAIVDLSSSHQPTEHLGSALVVLGTAAMLLLLLCVVHHTGSLTRALPETPLCRWRRRRALAVLFLSILLAGGIAIGGPAFARHTAIYYNIAIFCAGAVVQVAVVLLIISLLTARRELGRAHYASLETLFDSLPPQARDLPAVPGDGPPG